MRNESQFHLWYYLLYFAKKKKKKAGDREELEPAGPWECIRHVKSSIMCVMVSSHSPGTAKASDAGNSGPSVTFPHTVSLSHTTPLHDTHTGGLISQHTNEPSRGYTHTIQSHSHSKATQKPQQPLTQPYCAQKQSHYFITVIGEFQWPHPQSWFHSNYQYGT